MGSVYPDERRSGPGLFAAPARKALPLQLRAIRRTRPNVLPIGYCTLDISGRHYADIPSIRAGKLVFCARGFRNNPWDNRVQYRSSVMDRNASYGAGSGFTVLYAFHVQPGFRPSRLTAPTGQYTLCRLSINGTPAPWLPDVHELDEHFGTADITGHLRDGENTLTVTVNRFDVRMEVEPVYLMGDFGVQAADGRWVLVPKAALACGPWKEQLLPFYPYVVEYEYSAQLAVRPSVASLEALAFDGTAISARVNG